MPLLVAVEAESLCHVLRSVHVHRFSLLSVVRRCDRVPLSRSRFPTRGGGLGWRGAHRAAQGRFAPGGIRLRPPLRLLLVDSVGLIIDPVLLLLRVHLKDALLPSVVVNGDAESEARD